MVFLSRPDGHLLSPRWRWAGWVTVAGLGLHTLGTLTPAPGRSSTASSTATSPLAAAAHRRLPARRGRPHRLGRSRWWCGCGGPGTTCGASCCGSPPRPRLLAVGVVVDPGGPAVQGEEGTWLAGAAAARSPSVAVPLCVAVAVLRHRLLEIDLIVNRAVGARPGHRRWLPVGYVLVVVVVGRVVGAGGFWPSLLATAVVALAFQPLRRRVVRSRRPAGLRRGGRAVRGARRLQPPTRRQP